MRDQGEERPASGLRARGLTQHRSDFETGVWDGRGHVAGTGGGGTGPHGSDHRADRRGPWEISVIRFWSPFSTPNSEPAFDEYHRHRVLALNLFQIPLMVGLPVTGPCRHPSTLEAPVATGPSATTPRSWVAADTGSDGRGRWGSGRSVPVSGISRTRWKTDKHSLADRECCSARDTIP